MDKERTFSWLFGDLELISRNPKHAYYFTVRRTVKHVFPFQISSNAHFYAGTAFLCQGDLKKNSSEATL